jgi:hypothetical protein
VKVNVENVLEKKEKWKSCDFRPYFLLHSPYYMTSIFTSTRTRILQVLTHLNNQSLQILVVVKLLYYMRMEKVYARGAREIKHVICTYVFLLGLGIGKGSELGLRIRNPNRGREKVN